MNHIVVIGSCNMDLTVLSEKRPVAGETVLGSSLHISPGGKGANQAVAAAKLGAQVTMIGCIGDDLYGPMILENLQKHGINTDYMVTLPGESSGTAHITLAEGDNSIIVILGANAKVDPAVVDQGWAAIEQADLVMVQNEIPLPTIGYIIKRCHKANIPVLLNPAPAAALEPAWIEKATYVTPNEHELRTLFPGDDGQAIIKNNPRKFIVTLGKDGVAYGDNGEIVTVPSYVVQPVDTTGAGDTFNGAFATAIVNGKSMDDALAFGNAAAALSIMRLGAQEGMPTKTEVDAFMKEHA